jgi:hypothetical protein
MSDKEAAELSEFANIGAGGKRFLAEAPKNSRPEPYTLFPNWQSALKK